jgi:hypothetical protein
MPTVLRVGGFSFTFFAGDHEPAHVHVRNSDGVAIVVIETGEVRQTLGGIRDRDIKRAKALVAEHRDHLQRAWDERAHSEADHEG